LAADGVLNASLAESAGGQKPAAKSKFRCLFIEIGLGRGFWKAALRITPYFRRVDPGVTPGDEPVCMALSTPFTTYV
jgi:hypothetical protein